MTMLISIPVDPVPELPTYEYQNSTVTVDGQNSPVETRLHYAKENVELRMEADMVDFTEQGPYVVPITIPGVLGTPLVRFAGDTVTTDEVYFETTITDGHVVATGTLPSGSWRVLPDRVNKALAEINAPFRLKTPVVTFIVNRS